LETPYVIGYLGFTIFIRIAIFRYLSKSIYLKSNLYNLARFYWLITGKHIEKKGFCFSNYGVWLAVRSNDLTYDFCVGASYVNNLEEILKSISEEQFSWLLAQILVFFLSCRTESKHSYNSLIWIRFRNILVSWEKRFMNQIKSSICHNFAISTDTGDARSTKHDGHSGISRIYTGSDELPGDYRSIAMMNHIYLDRILTQE